MERIYWRFVRISSLRALIGLIVCCIIVGFIFDKLTEGRIWITKRVIDGSYTYIPEKSALCDEEGNRRYSSWDEYRLEYIEEHSDFLK